MEHYLGVERGEASPEELLRRMHRHVLDGCPECLREWEALSDEERAYLGRLWSREEVEPILAVASPAAGAARPGQPSPYAAAFTAGAKAVAAAGTQLALERNRARKDLAKLLAMPAGERLAALHRSRKRFRSATLAQLLVEEARTRVRRSPAEAVEVLDLVRPTLELVPGALGREWARALEVVAEALRANALRVAGDLLAADRAFRDVRRRLDTAMLDEPPPVEAEVASLEASLRRDQRRYDEAGVLLDRAALLYEAEGEAEGLARVLIKRAEIRQHFAEHEAALADLDRARELVHPERQPFLHLCTAVAAVAILVDLGRPRAAERILAQAEGVPAADEPWWRLRFRFLGGRIAIASADHRRAAALLAEARQGFLDQGLLYDSAAAALELALVALHQGDTRRVRELAREIAPVFRRCGVVREALATLALFEQAERADAAALALAAALRRHLADAQAASARRPQPPAAS
jgi:hypothetical protein